MRRKTVEKSAQIENAERGVVCYFPHRIISVYWLEAASTHWSECWSPPPDPTFEWKPYTTFDSDPNFQREKIYSDHHLCLYIQQVYDILRLFRLFQYIWGKAIILQLLLKCFINNASCRRDGIQNQLFSMEMKTIRWQYVQLIYRYQCYL